MEAKYYTLEEYLSEIKSKDSGLKSRQGAIELKGKIRLEYSGEEYISLLYEDKREPLNLNISIIKGIHVLDPQSNSPWSDVRIVLKEPESAESSIFYNLMREILDDQAANSRAETRNLRFRDTELPCYPDDEAICFGWYTALGLPGVLAKHGSPNQLWIMVPPIPTPHHLKVTFTNQASDVTGTPIIASVIDVEFNVYSARVVSISSGGDFPVYQGKCTPNQQIITSRFEEFPTTSHRDYPAGPINEYRIYFLSINKLFNQYQGRQYDDPRINFSAPHKSPQGTSSIGALAEGKWNDGDGMAILDARIDVVAS